MGVTLFASRKSTRQNAGDDCASAVRRSPLAADTVLMSSTGSHPASGPELEPPDVPPLLEEPPDDDPLLDALVPDDPLLDALPPDEPLLDALPPDEPLLDALLPEPLLLDEPPPDDEPLLDTLPEEPPLLDAIPLDEPPGAPPPFALGAVSVPSRPVRSPQPTVTATDRMASGPRNLIFKLRPFWPFSASHARASIRMRSAARARSLPKRVRSVLRAW